MRDARTTLAKFSRRKRRAVLVAVLVATTPALAEGPQRDSARILPPLPLKTSRDSNSIQANPFCEPMLDRRMIPVQLASGSDSSLIRLKPIGTAVGLQPIRGTEPIRVEPSAISIGPAPESPIQSNPLIESTHHVNRDLVDAEVDDAAPPAGKAAATVPVQSHQPKASKITLLPTAPPAIPAAPVAPAPQPVSVTAPVNAEASLAAAGLVPVPPNPETAVGEEQSEPVFFSFSDETLGDSAVPQPNHNPTGDYQAGHYDPFDDEPMEAAAQPAARSLVVQSPNEPQQSDLQESVDVSESVGLDEFADLEESVELPAATQLAGPMDAPQPQEMQNRSDEFASIEYGYVDQEAAALDLGVVEPLRLDAAEESPSLAPIESVTTRDRNEAVVRGPVSVAEPSLHTQRYRPPVAVTMVPLAYQRNDQQTNPTLQPAVESASAPQFGALPKDVELTPLYLSRAQVRSLTVGGAVRGVKVADKSICQAFSAGPNQLKLIGTGNGVTQLVVWADTPGDNAAVRMRAFEIHVKDEVDATGTSAANNTQLLNQSIRRAFPDCNVLVRSDGQELVVCGRCDSESSAKMIIRMVRKSCLVPVRDELKVH